MYYFDEEGNLVEEDPAHPQEERATYPHMSELFEDPSLYYQYFEECFWPNSTVFWEEPGPQPEIHEDDLDEESLEFERRAKALDDEIAAAAARIWDV